MPQLSNRPKRDVVINLQIAVAEGSLSAADAVTSSWEEITGEELQMFPEKSISDWFIRVELLGFFLHLLSRYASAIAGGEVRDALFEIIAPAVTRSLVEASFKTPPRMIGMERKTLHDGIINEVSGNIDNAELDYGSCTDIALESLSDNFREEKSVAGKLSGIIARKAGREHDPQLRLVIFTSSVKAVASVDFFKKIEAACKSLRGGRPVVEIANPRSRKRTRGTPTPSELDSMVSHYKEEVNRLGYFQAWSLYSFPTGWTLRVWLQIYQAFQYNPVLIIFPLVWFFVVWTIAVIVFRFVTYPLFSWFQARKRSSHGT